MIRRLRLKFVLMNMAFVTVLLGAVFAVVLHTTRNELAQASLRALEQAALESLGPGRPERRPGEPGGTPCFVLRTGPRGELIAAGDGYYDLTEEEPLRALLSAALERGSREGVLEDYGLRFYRSGPPDRPVVAFADLSGERRTMEALARNCLLAGSAAFLGFLAAGILLSRWAVGPVERAWEQQRQFVADASHELKTPLTVILTNAELLREGPAGEEERRRLTDNILTMARQMRALVESLLELARADARPAEGAMEPVDLSRLVREAMLPFEPVFFEAGLTLSGEVREGLRIRGAEGQLRQVADILLDNARKYTPAGGEVTVTLARSGRSCLLSVAGPGTPLTPQERRDVFKRFYRADPARSREGGWGLGLSIAQEIAIRHGGKIWADSGPEGNRFTVKLPLLRE